MTNSLVGVCRDRIFTTSRVAICVLASLSGGQALAQAPALLWTANTGGKLFGVDAQAVYVNAGTNVIKLNLNGVATQTNSICPLPGIAQLDASGNYFFAGNFDGTQNFGGITLVGGWTNWPYSGHWTAGYPTHFAAKYNNNGVLQWVKSFGQQASSVNRLTDTLVDSSSGLIAGHLGLGFSPGVSTFTRLDSNGNILWSPLPGQGGGATALKLGGLTSSNFCYLYYQYGIAAHRRDFAGAASGISTAALVPLASISAEVTNGTPVLDNSACLLLAGQTNGQQLLCKFDPSGSLLWAKPVNHGEQWPLARDASECFYFGSVSNVLIKYDANGTELWSTNYQKEAIKMIVDAAGNRFVGFADGTIARLAPDATPEPPSVLVAPQTQIATLGSSATFSATIGGSPTLYYQWRKDGTNVIGATATNYTIASVTTNHIGYYDLVVTNAYGAITSTPPAALLIAPSLLSPYVGAVGLWGQQATLSVSAWGSGTLSYQWYKSGQAISDATNSTLVFPSVQISDAGAYSVVVTSAYGSVTNTPADLVVNPAEVSIALYAGITIHGTIGYNYGIEYATNLQNAVWQYLTNVTLSQPTEIWVDTSVPAAERARRFYRVTNQ
jgi:hypothetical protein